MFLLNFLYDLLVGLGNHDHVAASWAQPLSERDAVCGDDGLVGMRVEGGKGQVGLGWK